MQIVKTDQEQAVAVKEPYRHLIKLKATLQPEEFKALELKYSCLPIRELNEQELFTVINALFTKIHVITSWVIPGNDMLPVFTDQFAKKLLEDYPTLNREEIEFAFRKFGSVKEWGKNFNLVLLDEVLTPYLAMRIEVSKIEEQASVKSVAALPGPKMTDQDIVDMAWDAWNVTGKFEYIVESAYEVLSEKQILVLSTEQKKQLMTAANGYMKEQETNGTKYSGVEWQHYQKRYAKKMAVARLFQEYKITNNKIVL